MPLVVKSNNNNNNNVRPANDRGEIYVIFSDDNTITYNIRTYVQYITTSYFTTCNARLVYVDALRLTKFAWSVSVWPEAMREANE